MAGFEDSTSGPSVRTVRPMDALLFTAFQAIFLVWPRLRSNRASQRSTQHTSSNSRHDLKQYMEIRCKMFRGFGAVALTGIKLKIGRP